MLKDEIIQNPIYGRWSWSSFLMKMVTRLKQEKRHLVVNSEANQKMHKEKIEKLQAELATKDE